MILGCFLIITKLDPDLSVKQEILDDDHTIASEDYVNALNGFLFILSPDFEILYCSENVKDYLGLSKVR